ncbi:MAG: Uma2 family endonuclease [Anaerolineae bacterium]|nr:Uma2 family endonuclease [Anaerolineae bacterium]
MREKAATYLQHGSRMVWLVFPDQEGVEVCRQGDEERITFEFVGPDGSLSGEDVLPGFELEMAHLFPTK